MVNVTGVVYGEVTPLEPTLRRQNGCVVWRCMCSCGTEFFCTSNRLRTGNTKSCGCRISQITAARNVANTKHGHAKTYKQSRTYRSWSAMIRRCEDENNSGYGGRGITVCDSWRADFRAFLVDMGERPAGTTIDRIDSNGNYEPGNCRWASNETQQRNRRDCRMLTYAGETLPLAVWADRLGCKHSALRMRLEKGWSVERALTTPVEYRQPRSKGAK